MAYTRRTPEDGKQNWDKRQRARRSQKKDTIVYDGFRYDWSTIHKAFWNTPLI